MSVLELRSISKVFGRGAAEVQALRDISMSVPAGMMVAVMGPSGSGKSSLLTIAGTLEEPTSGARRPGHDRRPDPLRDGQRSAHAHRDGGGRAHRAGADRRHRRRDRAARRGNGHGGRVPGLARVAHSSLTQTFGNVPWADIGLLVIGMPLVGAAAGWLLGGRAPSAALPSAPGVTGDSVPATRQKISPYAGCREYRLNS